MSTQYPDLPLTSFPQNLDNFPNYQNITPNDGNLIAQYMEAMNQGNQVLANQILAQIPNATQKIIKATDLNKVMQAVLATERLYKDDIYDYILKQQENWQNIINQFNYMGTYSSVNTYNKYNMVDYASASGKLLYIALQEVPPSTLPTNTTYWRILTIRGQAGEAGRGLSYRQQWQPTIQYQDNQAVTYDGSLWMSLQPNLNIQPGTNSLVWKKVIDFVMAPYPIQPTPPIEQEIGDLWFNTSDNPTSYVYLEPLENPATSAEVLTGYQAYGEEGIVLNGTAQPAQGDYVEKSEINQPNGVAGLNNRGVLDIRYGGTNASTEQQAIYNLGTGVRQNLLDNWFFLDAGHGRRFPINQRGQTSYTGAVYGIDRWKGVYGGETVRVENDRIQVIVQNNQAIRQILEPMLWIRGNFVTLSILCAFSGNYAGCSCIIDGRFHDGISLSTSGISLHSKTFKLPDDFTNLSIDISGDGTIDVYAIKFEIGQVQSLATQQSDGRWVVFDAPDYEMELLKCRRYLIMGPMEAPMLFKGFAYLNTSTTMRIAPSIIGTIYTYSVASNAQISDTNIVTHSNMRNGVGLVYTGTLEDCYVYFPSGTGLSAEL